MKKNKEKKTEMTFNPLLTGEDYPEHFITEFISVIHPPVIAQVDMNTFVRLVISSYSLCLAEKYRVIDSIPTLSQLQLDELIKVFEEETIEFYNLIDDEWDIIVNLFAKAWIEANMLANYFGVGYASEEAEKNAVFTMLTEKYDTVEKRKWVEKTKNVNSLYVNYIYGDFEA